MGDERVPALVYGLPLWGRCITSQTAEKECNRFLVGTQSIKEQNEIHLIEITEAISKSGEEQLSCSCKAAYFGCPETWDMASCPTDAQIFATAHNGPEGHMGATVWRMVPDKDQLERLADIPLSCDVYKVAWEGGEHARSGLCSLVTVSREGWELWNFPTGDAARVAGVKMDKRPFSVRWNPVRTNEIATTVGSAACGWDLRSATTSWEIPKAHDGQARAIDFNPNLLDQIVTGGDDCFLKFWDIRKADKPTVLLQGHTHWVWDVKYNTYHDNLVLSSSTDSSVCLWKVTSISSPPLVGEEEEMTPRRRSRNPDYLVKSFDDHEHSVYSVAWAESNAYIFASLSHDGRVVINQVPEREREYEMY